MLRVSERLFVLLVCVATLQQSLGELFTAISHLQRAVFAERDIAGALRQYVQAEELRLEKLRRLAEDMEGHSQLTQVDLEKHIGNPVNAFLFVKRFTLDWDRDVEVVLKNNSWEVLTQQIAYLRQDLPTYEDLSGTAAALMRLQDTYQLDTEKLAEGDIAGIPSAKLTAEACFELGRIYYNDQYYGHTVLWMDQALAALETEGGDLIRRAEVLDYLAFSLYKEDDVLECLHPGWTASEVLLCIGFCTIQWAMEECFQIGRFAYILKDYYHTILWMQAALAREKNGIVPKYEKVEIRDYLSYALAMHGELQRALTLTDELLILEPDHERARNNKMYFERMLADEISRERRGDEGPSKVKIERKLDAYRNSDEYFAYERLCRGEDLFPKKRKPKLTCRYTSNNGHPLLLLQPVKLEEVHLRPWIVKFHDVMSDSEIATIKRIATPKLNRATVQNSKTGQLETADYRISKSAWLTGGDDPVVRTINNRIQAITGLDVTTAEELQVANYGIGGHYEPHFDFARKEETEAFKSLGTGNRIATFLVYMTDVEAGGATVFPYIGVKLWPTKGAAAFWYNLYKNGDGIYDTRHAACPVLVGVKWVSNKWIHERGQEFRRPCSKTADE